MPRIKRPHPAGNTLFFTVRADARGGSPLTDHIDALRAAVGLTRRDMPFHVDAWVVLPDHMHAVLTFRPGDEAIAARWRAIRTRFDDSLPRALRREGTVWNGEELALPVRDLVGYAAAMRRCWFDPVRHGLARLPEHWEYSSIHSEVAAGRMVA